MLVQDVLHDSVVRLPQKVALVCDNQHLTYSQIEAMANRLANAMLERGLRRGDRVVICLENSVEAVVGVFATLKAGGVFVPVNHSTKVEKLAYILNNCNATILILDSAKASMLDALAAHVTSLQLSIVCGTDAADRCLGRTGRLEFAVVQATYPADRPSARNIDLDLACLLYTSGTTGDPKGVMCDHSNMVFVGDSVIEYLENVEEDVITNVLPLSFGYGLYQLLMVFRFGGTLVLERSFAYPAAVLKRMEAERVTGFSGVPTIYALLLQMDLSRYDLSSLRYFTNAAAALPLSHIQALRERLPQAKLFSMYGQTETKRTLYLPPAELDRRPESVGIAIPGTEVWIEDEAGNLLPPGQVGELVVRGRHVMRGYWADPEATAHRFRPGPLPGERVCYSGDLFRMDEDGFLYFVARKDDIIKCGGEKVAPKEVENVLYGLQGVVEAAVVGVPDPMLGYAIKAFVVCQGHHLTATEVRSHCYDHLEEHMVPKYVEFRDELPKTTSGKIKKTDLR
jgi:long-chain acyl-CoA synthetase